MTLLPVKRHSCLLTGALPSRTTLHCKSATAALAAAGYRATRESHHYRVMQSLEFTVNPGRKVVDTLDGFRKKRNISSYDLAGAVSDSEADEMIALAAAIRSDVEKWIRSVHPELFR